MNIMSKFRKEGESYLDYCKRIEREFEAEVERGVQGDNYITPTLVRRDISVSINVNFREPERPESPDDRKGKKWWAT